MPTDTIRPPRPPLASPILDNIPRSMREWSHWVYWRWQWNDDQGRWAKVLKTTPPIINGLPGRGFEQAKSNDPTTWREFESVALDLTMWDELGINGGRLGIGYVLGDDDPFTVIDLDKCRDKETSVITPEATAIITRFNSYTEVSPSGTGVKIFIQGRKPQDASSGKPKCKVSYEAWAIEIYDHLRFMTMTGDILPGLPKEPQCRQAELDAFYAELFPPAPPRTSPVKCCGGDHPRPSTPSPSPSPLQHLSDLDVVERASMAANGEKFDRLWHGDASGQNNDRSAADFALASMLAFWVGPDVSRIISLMRQSGLRRAKWDRPDYLTRTVERALSGRVEFYTGDRRGKRTPDKPGTVAAIPTPLVFAPGCEARGSDGGSETDNLTREQREMASAQRIAEMRRDFETYACGKLNNQLLRSREDGTPCVIRVRCEGWKCSGCRKWLVARILENAKLRFGNAEALYWVRASTAKEQAIIVRRIRRLGKNFNYFCIREGDGYRIVSNGLTAGAAEVSPAEAYGKVEGLMRGWYENYSPVSTSRGWSLPTDPRSRKFEHIGKCDPHLSPSALQEIGEAAGLEAHGSRPQNSAREIVEWWTFGPRKPRDAGDDWQWPGGEEQFKHLKCMLFAGQVLPKDIAVIDPFVSNPYAPAEDDAVNYAYHLWADA